MATDDGAMTAPRQIEREEMNVRIAATLYDAQRTMQSLHGDKYASRVDEVRPVIEAYMAQAGVVVLVAATHIAKKMTDNDAPFLALMVLATAVEMMEPLRAADRGEG